MSKIEWLQHPAYKPETWNPVTGCTKCATGCKHCYAETVANRFWGERKFTDVQTHHDRLEKPLHWRKPRLVFVNSMSDLFHPDVPFEFIASVFGVMAAEPKHRFVILTKRIQRACEFFVWVADPAHTAGFAPEFGGPEMFAAHCASAVRLGAPAGKRAFVAAALLPPRAWPLPNVAIGVSVSTQADADAAVPQLLECTAAMETAAVPHLLGRLASLRLVSYEPALEPVDFAPWLTKHYATSEGYTTVRGIDWLLIGGESGAGARQCDVEWLRASVHHAKAAGVPVFVKQCGARRLDPEETGLYENLRDPKGADPSEWPADLRIREYPEEWLA